MRNHQRTLVLCRCRSRGARPAGQVCEHNAGVIFLVICCIQVLKTEKSAPLCFQHFVSDKLHLKSILGQVSRSRPFSATGGCRLHVTKSMSSYFSGYVSDCVQTGGTSHICGQRDKTDSSYERLCHPRELPRVPVAARV